MQFKSADAKELIVRLLFCRHCLFMYEIWQIQNMKIRRKVYCKFYQTWMLTKFSWKIWLKSTIKLIYGKLAFICLSKMLYSIFKVMFTCSNSVWTEQNYRKKRMKKKTTFPFLQMCFLLKRWLSLSHSLSCMTYRYCIIIQLAEFVILATFSDLYCNFLQVF